METVAADIRAAGGSAEVAILDATDERAVDSHVEAAAAQAGGVDVSFNLISRGDVQRTPLVDPRGRPHRRDHHVRHQPCSPRSASPPTR